MDVVQATNLREETSVGFVVVASVVDGACPVVAPLDHGARFQTIRAHLVDIRAITRLHHWPVAEGQQILQVTGPQKPPALNCEFHIILKLIYEI